MKKMYAFAVALCMLAAPSGVVHAETVLEATQPLQTSAETTAPPIEAAPDAPSTLFTTTRTGQNHSSDQVLFNIKQLPEKTVYQIGEELDLTGGTAEGYATIGGIHFDAFTQPMTYYNVDDSGFDNTHAGTYEIRLTWFGKTISFPVEVVAGSVDADSSCLEGDVNCNGEIEIADPIILCRSNAEDSLVSITAQGSVNADCDHDGLLSAADVTLILQKMAEC